MLPGSSGFEDQGLLSVASGHIPPGRGRPPPAACRTIHSQVVWPPTGSVGSHQGHSTSCSSSPPRPEPPPQGSRRNASARQHSGPHRHGGLSAASGPHPEVSPPVEAEAPHTGSWGLPTEPHDVGSGETQSAPPVEAGKDKAGGKFVCCPHATSGGWRNVLCSFQGRWMRSRGMGEN